MRTRLLYVLSTVFAVTVIGAVLLFGRDTDPEPAVAGSSPSLSPTPSPPPTAETLTMEQAAYLRVVRPMYPADTDENILELGETICGALSSGVTMKAVAESFTDVSAASRNELMSAATVSLCPAHQRGFEQYRLSLPPTIDDGTWTVGVDVPPGTYRVRLAASSDCYWAILRSGSNGEDIINNDIGGGRPQVTLRRGQDFETSRCGTWTKI